MQKMFENNFLQRVKDLRKALHESTVKHLSQHKSTPVGIRTILNVSDQRISRVIEQIDRVDPHVLFPCLHLILSSDPRGGDSAY